MTVASFGSLVQTERAVASGCCDGPGTEGQQGGSDLNLVTLSLFAGLPGGGLRVIDDLFCVGIPLDGAIESNGDIGEVADGHGAMVAVDIADGLSSVTDAFEEVLHMVTGSFAFVEGFQGFLFQRVGFEGIDGIAG